MNRTWPMFIAVLLALAGCRSGHQTDKPGSMAAAEKPNVIIILTDQWRAQSTGYGGNPDVITPNLDRLAGQSVVFNTAVAVMPVCSPYRASLLTGQYPLTHGIFHNDKPLPNEALTMAEIYKEAGYQTGYIGKWHLNGHKEGEHTFHARTLPVKADRRQGFDYWKVAEVTHNYNNSFYYDEQDQKHIWPGYDAFPQTDSAISFIRRQQDNPFLLVLSWGPPHDPYFTAPEKFQQMYDRQKVKLRANVPEALQDSARRVLASYYAHCSALDQALGDLLETLDQQGIADNTILVFTSDHGDMLLSKGQLKKQRPWDESVLVPMLVRYPAGLGRQARQVNNPINTPDILPTLLGLSNLEVPATVEGRDLSGALREGQELPDEATLFMMVVPFHEWTFMKGGKEYRAIRTQKYTYARDLSGPWLLYDNEQDPYQDHNLVGQPDYAQVQARLEGLLQQKLKDTKDEFLPADEYMTRWKYRYDHQDSIRPPSYYSNLKKQ